MAPKPPDWTPSAPNDVICVDIETYGALKNYNQTVFHPVKMEYVDKVPTAQQIKTVAVSMIGPDGEPWSSVFVWTSGYHRLRFKQFMEWASSNHLALLCQNLLFDVTVLRRQPGLDTLITPDTFRLEDTLLWNFLHSEVRPERSLKSASALFNLASYNNLTTEFSSGGYSSVNDPDLHKYNVLDTVATLHLREYLLSLIAKDYGENSPKLGPVCRQHCSELLWAGVFMSEAGIAYDRGALETLRRTCLTEMERLCKLADWEFGLKLEGQGSQKPLKELFTRCVEEADLLSNPQLELTDKTKEISTKNSNISLIIENLPLDSELRTPITLLSMHRKLQKVVSTYLNNLLDNPAKGLVHPTEQNSNVWLAYPSWYVYPSKYGNDEKEGGTIQGRITCKYPPEQTNPPTIKEKRTTRFPGGLLREYDLSQIELRVGAMLSGDQVMAYEYQQRLDRHALTGALFWSIVEGTNKDDFHKLMKTSPKDYTFYRQAGKTANFLVIYEGKARKLQSVFLSMLGFEAPLHHCQAFITAHDARYTKLRGWQEGLKTFAIQHGYVVLPTGWSHLFWGGKDVVRGLDAPKVCNAPVQTFAAQLMQSSQFLIVDTFRKQQLRSVCELNTYDSILIDSPPEEAEVVDKIVGFGLENPPLLERLAGKIPANVPIEYDCKIVYNGQDT
jgi:DNA polymerase I-like protein with 3'-5' exonuclease and polymerase domains